MVELSLQTISAELFGEMSAICFFVEHISQYSGFQVDLSFLAFWDTMFVFLHFQNANWCGST